MKLLYQTHSPYARKALVFAYEVGLADRLEVVHHETSPTWRNEEVFVENPLGKVPVLIRDGLPALFDSTVICEYLDTLHSGRPLVPPSGELRWQALRVQALAQGIADAGIALRWETERRPEAQRNALLAEGYAIKLMSAYHWLKAHFDMQSDIDIGHISLATALSWIEFRHLPGFRETNPQLADWLDRFDLRPSMVETPLSGETHD